MPQMGESITEGTITKWLKQVGEKIDRDEPLLEISTDKVDAEIPSPAAGILLEIRNQEGETVEVNHVIAVIGEEGEKGAPAQTAPAEKPAEKAAETAAPATASSSNGAAIHAPQADGTPTAATTPEPEETKPAAPAVEPAAETAPAAAPASTEGATEIVMPQMGESITEGTITKWLKNVGDKVERDEPLFEISTDKVDAEIPSPVSGTLLEIKNQEGETVEVGHVVALVGAEGGAPVTTPAAAPKTEAPAPPASAGEAPKQAEAPKAEAVAAAPAAAIKSSGNMSLDELRRTKSSPLVRNIAKEHNVDITKIPGSGMSGRVTKKDILSFIDSGAAVKPEDLLVGKAAPATPPQTAPPVTPATSAPSAAPLAQRSGYAAPALTAGAGDRIEPMSVMRKKIAEHMVYSKQTSAHVTSVYEIDMSNVAKFREANKAAFQERFGTKLTYMPFIFQAVTQALRKIPVVNAQVSEDKIIYKGDINLGMAVALDWGLIVPVIKRADQLSLSGLALAANDLADRARMKKLMPDEVSGGTFTITNPGVFGGLFGTPIINQPQVAILCVGAVEKRAKVLTTPDGDDYIAIRSMAYFALTYDHRIVDGADGERFLAFMKDYLENTQFSV
jgi:2-oxoglutarate dehydrogenase E2 component (dihydrolipoamide succinyltransferase)